MPLQPHAGHAACWGWGADGLRSIHGSIFHACHSQANSTSACRRWPCLGSPRPAGARDLRHRRDSPTSQGEERGGAGKSMQQGAGSCGRNGVGAARRRPVAAGTAQLVGEACRCCMQRQGRARPPAPLAVAVYWLPTPTSDRQRALERRQHSCCCCCWLSQAWRSRLRRADHRWRAQPP